MPQRKPVKEEREWPSLLLGWTFVTVALFGLVFFILSSRPDTRRLVCQEGREVSLTRFGSCKLE